jgi:hypothetical protein
MKPNIKFFYNEGCDKCNELKPIINEFKTSINIEMVNANDNDVLLENYNIEWVPSLVIEDQNGKHLFEGVKEIKKVLHEIVSP